MNLQRKCEGTFGVNASRWVFMRLLALLSAEVTAPTTEQIPR